MLTDDFGNEFYDTEISRRFSHFSQPIHQFGSSNISAALIVKQGILNQGGPADIFLRLTRVPDDVVWEACELDGDADDRGDVPARGLQPLRSTRTWSARMPREHQWEFLDGDAEPMVSNPRYLEGYCLSTASMSPASPRPVAEATAVPSRTTAAQTFPKVTEWDQTRENLDDESWESPWDVSKGHRGFIDGDFIMMMYAWAPNWKANTVGNDHYNLYARRSFDGGTTWTTLPANYTHVDGTVLAQAPAPAPARTMARGRLLRSMHHLRCRRL